MRRGLALLAGAPVDLMTVGTRVVPESSQICSQEVTLPHDPASPTSTGIQWNVHSAAICLGLDGTAYVATLTGPVRLRDG